MEEKPRVIVEVSILGEGEMAPKEHTLETTPDYLPQMLLEELHHRGGRVVLNGISVRYR